MRFGRFPLYACLLVAASWLAASGSASGLTSPRPSCTAVSRGATILLSNTDGQIFSRPSRYGTTFFYGCFNGQPHTRLLSAERPTKHPLQFAARAVAGGFAAYSTQQNIVNVTDLVHARRIFARPHVSYSNAYSTGGTAVGELLLNRFGRVAWIELSSDFPRGPTGGRPSGTAEVLLHDRRGTTSLDSEGGPIPSLCCLGLGVRSVTWRVGSPRYYPLKRALVF